MDHMAAYRHWVEHVTEPERAVLQTLEGDDEAIRDAFYCELAFGTAGLRGTLGLGTNRMNIYTVGRATQGLADYLNANAARDEQLSVAVCRDSRHMGEEFVRVVGEVLAANGITAHIYPRIEPTPALSFAVRDLHCSAGINVTASHNPAEYNGYKAYGPDGCQITSEFAAGISAAIDKLDYFGSIRRMDFDSAVEQGLVRWIGEDTLDRFVEAVLSQSLASGPEVDPSQLKLVYTPLNGTGLECISRVLERIGVTDITVVPEQAEPDGDFPTCPYPNPEIREALELGIGLCEEVHPDLLLATDPDADRTGAAVVENGECTLITGNEMGILLLDYVAGRRAERGEELSRAVAVTTIVSSTMVDAIAREYGFEVRRTLTGFKYIGEQIGLLEAVGEEDRFIFGFEESYGYLAGTHARDKDAVVTSMLVCEMAAWHKAQGRNLVQAIEALYEKHGWYRNRTISLAFPGADGALKMRQLMTALHSAPPAELAGSPVERVVDYKNGTPMAVLNGEGDEGARQTIPPADVVELFLPEGDKVMVRPSGTEPKVKVYLFAKADSAAAADARLDELEAAARGLLG